ncbi:Signal peptidase I [hydrothermal vent metagenome]|uniref:signal peptidase I n=1 Tax=hydrothermal vent metagenome TaxID=652676 RepID=A0A3B1C6R2_9ZZZZ
MGHSSFREKWKTIREYLDTLVIAIILALVIRTFVVQAFKIPSGSMIPTLLIGDHILVNKFIYGVKLPFTDIVVIPITVPERGDVIVFRFPKDESKDFIKRVVGIPGDKVEVRNKVLYVNGIEQNELFTNDVADVVSSQIMASRDNFGPVNVPENSYFVMGDNRDHSLDSRFWGFVDFSKIKGEAFLIYWSWDKESKVLEWLGGWSRWGRIGKVIR